MGDDLDARLSVVRTGLERLRAAKGATELFGARSHQLVAKPPIAEADVVRFEAEHGIQLPADYRAFLTRIAGGGLGPFYGIFPLGESDEGKWKKMALVGDPARPFPYETAWNLSEAELHEIQNDDYTDHEGYDEYWRPLHGAIPISHQGCNLRDWLVVSGSEAGHVWHDGRADFAGVKPWASGAAARAETSVTWVPGMIKVRGNRAGRAEAPSLRRLTFLDWYEGWLFRALAECAEA